MNVQASSDPAAAAALVLASLAARSAVVSPEVEARVRAGQARIPILVSLREGARRPGFSITRRLANAPVATGWATAADIAALAASTDVLHVGFDRLVRPAGQIGTAQIGADRLLSLGVTGRGRASRSWTAESTSPHPHLKPPSTSGWPGWNFADDNGDLADCNGHGTEVAGVVAGPQGIAPEAGLVVLRSSALATDAAAHAPQTCSGPWTGPCRTATP